MDNPEDITPFVTALQRFHGVNAKVRKTDFLLQRLGLIMGEQTCRIPIIVNMAGEKNKEVAVDLMTKATSLLENLNRATESYASVFQSILDQLESELDNVESQHS